MWSFAILLWELVTREVPFADLSNMEIGMKVSSSQKSTFFYYWLMQHKHLLCFVKPQIALEGLRPTIPPGISPHICKLMKICMNEDPAKRPKFDMIVPILDKMQDKWKRKKKQLLPLSFVKQFQSLDNLKTGWDSESRNGVLVLTSIALNSYRYTPLHCSLCFLRWLEQQSLLLYFFSQCNNYVTVFASYVFASSKL